VRKAKDEIEDMKTLSVKTDRQKVQILLYISELRRKDNARKITSYS